MSRKKSYIDLRTEGIELLRLAVIYAEDGGTVTAEKYAARAAELFKRATQAKVALMRTAIKKGVRP